MKYSNDSTLGGARQQYFARSGFDERGYADKWVQLKAGPISFYFPNTQARVRAVKLHDLHHVLTEYDTNWRGEAEIGAWEIASGCGRYLAAWALNLGAFGLGLALAPRRVYRAFLRGRQTGNLYFGEFAECFFPSGWARSGASCGWTDLRRSRHGATFLSRSA